MAPLPSHQRRQPLELFDREMRAAQDHHVQPIAVRRGQLGARRAQILSRDFDARLRCAPLKGVLDCRRLGRDAHEMKERDTARRRHRCGERLQLIFSRPHHEADDDRDAILSELADQVTEHREKLIVLLQRRRDARESNQQLARAVLREMQTGCWSATGDRTADVQQVRVALRSCANH
jgi:hypothetical protein